MTEEKVLNQIYHVYANYSAGKNKPKFLYISLNEWVELVESEFFKSMCIPALDGKPTILGMEIVRVDKTEGFIRVGE